MAKLIFRQLFDPHSSTYSYLLGDARSRETVLIDPVFEQARRDAALIQELDLKLVATLETHVHADHVTGAWLLKRQLGSDIALSASSGAKGARRGGTRRDNPVPDDLAGVGFIGSRPGSGSAAPLVGLGWDRKSAPLT